MGVQTPIANPSGFSSLGNNGLMNLGTASSIPMVPFSPMTAPGAYPGNLNTPLPEIPPPSALWNPPSTPVMSPMAYYYAPYQTNTPSPSMPGALAEIPPPHMVAPYLYTQFPKLAPPQIFQPQTPPMPPQAPQPPQPPVATPQQQPPMQAPPQPQQQPVAPQPPAQQQPPANNIPTPGPYDDVIKRLNAKLNSENPNVRMDGGTDLLQLLQRNAKLGSDPGFKPYTDAFVDKIMADPSEMARMPGLMILQLGLDKPPTTFSKNRLQELAHKRDNTDYSMPDTGEVSMANDILTMLDQPAPPPKAITPPAAAPAAQQANPGALPDFTTPATPNGPMMPAASSQSMPQMTAPPASMPPQEAFPTPVAQQASPGPLPNFTTPAMQNSPVMPNAGGQLNVTSPPPPQMQMSPLMAPPGGAGQQFNIQEGR